MTFRCNFLEQMKNACCFTLRNGLRVCLLPQSHLHSVSACLAIGCGSRHESIHEWGLTHLLEHMLFRGSSAYPSGRHLAAAFENTGGQINGATWRDQTVFSANLQPGFVESGLAALANMIHQPLFADLALEKQVVREELFAELLENGEEADCHNLSRRTIWQNHPMGRRIVGSEASLSGLSLQHLKKHHQRFYVANNMVLVLAGCLSEHTQELVEHYFSPLPARPILTCASQSAPPFTAAPPNWVEVESMAQCTLQLSIKAPSQNHRDFLAVDLLTRTLDDGLSSRLPYALSYQHSLVYNLNASLDCYQDCGCFDVQISVAPECLLEALQRLFEVLNHVGQHGVSSKELFTAKQRYFYEFEQLLDDPQELSELVATYWLFNPNPRWRILFNHIRKIGNETIHRVAKQLLHRSPRHLCTVGPGSSLYHSQMLHTYGYGYGNPSSHHAGNGVT